MAYKRGDVVLVRFPNTDLTTFKNRPALIVQSDFVKTGIAQRIVVLITSNAGRKGPTRVPVSSSSDLGHEMGILVDSVIVVDNIATVPEKALHRVIGRCSFMDKIDVALRLALSL